MSYREDDAQGGWGSISDEMFRLIEMKTMTVDSLKCGSQSVH